MSDWGLDPQYKTRPGTRPFLFAFLASSETGKFGIKEYPVGLH